MGIAEHVSNCRGRAGGLPEGEEQRAAGVAWDPETLALDPTLHRTTCDIWGSPGHSSIATKTAEGTPLPPGRQVSKPEPWPTPEILHHHVSCTQSGWTREVSLPGHPKFP